jgi:hypothetical protein
MGEGSLDFKYVDLDEKISRWIGTCQIKVCPDLFIGLVTFAERNSLEP